MTLKCVFSQEKRLQTARIIQAMRDSLELGRLDHNKHGKRKKASEAQLILGFTGEAVKWFVHNLSLIWIFQKE